MSKSFQGLEADYKFFEECISEKEGAIEAWNPYLDLLRGRESLKILDFGAGSGGFTKEILALLGHPPEKLSLSLVEPASSSLQAAEACFAEEGLGFFEAVSSVEELKKKSFDLILSHHVFYYVPELSEVLCKLRSLLAESGYFLATVTGEKSGAGTLQETALALAGLTSPYRTGPEARDIFLQVFPAADVLSFDISLKMEDTRPNRESIMRFLVGEFLSQLPWEEVVSIFDHYSSEGQIFVPSEEFALVGKL